MKINDVYRHWAAEHYACSAKVGKIKSVAFSHRQNDYRDLDPGEVDTFNGCEMWSMTVYLKDGSEQQINLWDSNPASAISSFARQKGWTIEFDPPEEPSQEEQVEAHLRRW